MVHTNDHIALSHGIHFVCTAWYVFQSSPRSEIDRVSYYIRYTVPDNHASAKVTFVQFRKAPCIPNDRSREYTTTFVFKVSNLMGEIFTFKIIIPQENNNPYIRNTFPTGNIENPIGISKNPTEIIFSKVSKYILHVFNSDRQFSYIKFIFPIGLNEILFRSNPIGIFIPIGKKPLFR